MYTLSSTDGLSAVGTFSHADVSGFNSRCPGTRTNTTPQVHTGPRDPTYQQRDAVSRAFHIECRAGVFGADVNNSSIHFNVKF